MLAGVGAGIVHATLALATASRLTDVPPGAAGVACGFLAIAAIAELAWGLIGLVINRTAVPRFARWAALVPVVGWVLMLVSGELGSGAPADSFALPFLPMGTATLFDLFIAAGLSVRLRAPRRASSLHPGSDRADVRGASVLSLVAAGLMVSALVAPALSETASWRLQVADTQQFTPEHGAH
ncbi:hypothetical protein GCM10027052_22740 [Parafrigoribacterium mesophilum]